MTEPKAKPESIREWYQRTTRKARRALVGATAVSCVVMALMWAFSEMATLQKLQTFNGALTVPLIGGIWIFAFIFMFLVPSREASFRAQEALENGIEKLDRSIEQYLKPAAEVWHRVGLQVEKEYPELRKRLEESIADLKKTSVRVEKALDDNTQVVADAKPVLAALKRIEDRIEADLLDDVKDMVEAVKRMSGVPPTSKAPAKPQAPAAAAEPEQPAPAPAELPPLPAIQLPEVKDPNLSVALSSIRKKRSEAAQTQPK